MTRTSGFSLMEINMAIFVMALGILAMVALFPLGMRENSQSREDMAQSLFANAVLNVAVTALSQTNITWSAWNGVKSTSTTDMSALSSLCSLGKGISMPSFNTPKAYSISVERGEPGNPDAAIANPRIIAISVRSSSRKFGLKSAPTYYTEVSFQGKEE